MTIFSQAGTRVTNNATQAITTPSTAVTWSSAPQDNDTLWSAGSPTLITSNSSCWHTIMALVKFEAGAGKARIDIAINGTAIDQGLIVQLRDGFTTSECIARMKSLTATDTISVLITPIEGSPVVSAGSTLDVCYGQIGTGAITTAKLGTAAVTAAKALVFMSTQQTATGSAQNVAHGLAAAPTIVTTSIEVGHDGAGATGDKVPTITQGTHTSTNVVITVTAGAKFRVFAWA